VRSSAHFRDIYGASVPKETVSRITDKVVAEREQWTSRPLDAAYAAVFVDAVHVKVRDGQVANRRVYAAIGVSLGRPQGRPRAVDGHRWRVSHRAGGDEVPVVL
jgi:transposase-like protein